MWRYLAGAGAIVAAIGGGVAIMHGHADPQPRSVLAAQTSSGAQGTAGEPLPDSVPEATAATREEKRFGRYDKDRDGTVTREEYLAQRRKAFAKLDADHDGRLSFDEWAIKATTKFAAADGDKSGAMNAAEFATTAVKRKAQVRTKCPPAQPRDEQEG